MDPYLGTLIQIMRDMERNSARSFAHYLSDVANEALLSQKTFLIVDHVGANSKLIALFAHTPLTAEMASTPWLAYNLSLHDDEHVFYAVQSSLSQLLATMPIEYKLRNTPSHVVGPYADSLVSNLARLISQAETDLLIVGPYWSEKGVSEIRRRIDKEPRENLEVTLIAAADLDDANSAGLKAFSYFLKHDLDARVRVMEPRRLAEGRYPLVHAKVIVSDRRNGYVGSANFSQNGLTQSIEMGVSLAGTMALQLHEWFESILPYFVELEDY